MARLYDGNKTVDIQLISWNGHEWTSDWSEDFFAVGELEYNEELESYKVEDVDYCIEQANDWKLNRGDYEEDNYEEDSREVIIEELK